VYINALLKANCSEDCCCREG